MTSSHRLFAVVAAAIVCAVNAYDNGYGLKPFLGWQSWCAVGKVNVIVLYSREEPP